VGGGVLVGKPEGERPLGRPRRRWVDNIRMDLQEVGCGYMDWIGLAQDRDTWRTLVSAVMNLRVTWNAGNLSTSCKPVSFSRRTLHRGVSKWTLPGGGVGSQPNMSDFMNTFLTSKIAVRFLCAYCCYSFIFVYYALWEQQYKKNTEVYRGKGHPRSGHEDP